jgi:L-ascorbate metabolism protein UlaG (beta-lactamase superfamily)
MWSGVALADYRFKAETPVFVPTKAMAARARAAGFAEVAVVEWGSVHRLPGTMTLEVAPSQFVTGMKTNNYVVSVAGCRVFVGTEARDLEPLRSYRASRPRVDVVIAPIDGTRLLGHKLVMDPHEALEATRILGARTLVPFHYAVKARPLLVQTPFSERDLRRLARDVTDVDVVCLPTGVRWEYRPQHWWG